MKKVLTGVRRAPRRGLASLCAVAVLIATVAVGAFGADALLAEADAARRNTKSEGASMWMTVGERRFAVTLGDTPAAKAFAARVPFSIDMSDLNGNEKHAKLRSPLPADASRPGTIRTGDVMLWGSDTLVVFYLTFESPYSYTRIARVDDPAGLRHALGAGDARVSFSKD
jgi:hypothetical protein